MAVNFEPKWVVLLVRTYEEADAPSQGRILEGFDNNRCSLFHLPLQCVMPMDYYLSANALGHVRLKSVEKIGTRTVTRMHRASHRSDRSDLIKAHTEAASS